MEAYPRPRVAMLATEYAYNKVGGLGAHVRALVPRLSERIDLDLCLPRYDPNWPASELIGAHGQIHRIDATRPAEGTDFVYNVWQMNDALNAYLTKLIENGQHFDLLHAHDWLVGFLANDLHRRYGIPLVVTFHATEWGRRGGHLYSDLSHRIHKAEHHLAQHADLIITCSHFMRDEVVRELAAAPDKVVVIPNGVDSDRYRGLREQRASEANFRARWAQAGEPLIFNIGRLVWEKGADVLVAAMHTVRQEFPGARAVIAGTGSLYDNLATAIAREGLQDHVYLPGFIDDETRNKLYAVADVAVFPSRYEPFGIVALEAMAAGVPVVVAGGSGLGEVVDDTITGLCVAPADASALAQGILQVLRHPAEAAARAARAEEVAQKEYSWDRIARLTLAAYDWLREGRRSFLGSGMQFA